MKKVWICLLAVFMLVSAFSFAGAAAELSVADGKAAVDLGAVSIAAGSPVDMNVKVAGLEASEPIEFFVTVADASGQPVNMALTSLITTIAGENLDTTQSLILVGGYPIANGFSFSSEDAGAYPITISGKLVAIDASKPLSLDLGFVGTAQTAVVIEEAKAEIAAENIESVADGATLAVKGAAVNLDEEFVIKGGEVVVNPTEQPTETPTEIPTEQPTGTPTEIPTEQPTETPASPAPVLGLLAGLAAAGLFLRRE